MTSPQSFEKIKPLKVGSDVRQKAVALYLIDRGEDFRAAVARRAGVSKPMVSRVLHGRSVSAKVVRAILLEEESQSKGKVRSGNAA